MQYRGHILIVFALSLMASPWAIKTVLDAKEQQTATAPARVVTEGQASAACDRSAIDTAIGRLGCTETSNRSTIARVDRTMVTGNAERRIQSSGALFLSARRN